MVRRRERASPLTSRTCATPSTCPDTRCPPSASPALSAGSRFTAAPDSSSPRVVSASVSRDTSAAKLRACTAVAVRQQPCTQILSPTRTPDRSRRGAAITRRTSPPRASRACTLPMSWTIPVNTAAPASDASVTWPQPQPQVIAQRLGVDEPEGACRAQRRRLPQLEKRSRLVTEQLRRHVQQQLVHQRLLHQLARQSGSRFDLPLVDFQLTPPGEHRAD